MITRRNMLAGVAAGSVSLMLAKISLAGSPFDLTLPPLPYAFDALEPFIDAQTMQIHHGKHHQAYIDKLKPALQEAGAEWSKLPLVELLARYKEMPASVQTAVRNHGGGHYNHTLFWSMMAPAGKGGQPNAELQAAINAAFGSQEEMQKALAAKAAGQFGSGWGWLVLNAEKKLQIVSTANQDNPVMEGLVPLLGVDVWEHAYYLKYQNRRADYLTAWFQVVNWNRVNELYAATK